MCGTTLRSRFTVALAYVTCPALLTAAFFAQAQRGPAAPPSTVENSLKTFLRGYLAAPPRSEDKTTRYSAAFVDLNGDGTPEAIIHVTGRQWCGSGGCHMLILARKGSSYRVVTETTITRPPVRVLRSTSHGWRNIAVWVEGGGIQPGYEAELQFDGTTYPSNPTAPPARPLAGNVAGDVVLSGSEDGTLLYP